MKQEGETVGMLSTLGRIWDHWDQYHLEVTCHSALNIWQRERPEYIDKIRRWIRDDQIPEDNDLQTLCRIYRERLQARPCYRCTKS